MEEFRAAHSRMFGKTGKKPPPVKPKPVDCQIIVGNSNNCSQTVEQITRSEPPGGQRSPVQTNNNNISTQQKNVTSVSPVNGNQTKTPISTSVTNSNGETVTILRTTSPTKKTIAPPPPPPLPGGTGGGHKKSQAPKPPGIEPIVTISTYGNKEPKQRFIPDSNKNVIKVPSGIAALTNGIGECGKPGGTTFNTKTNDNESSGGFHPISIKINLK